MQHINLVADLASQYNNSQQLKKGVDMRLCCLYLSVILSFGVFAATPCEIVGFDKLLEYTVSDPKIMVGVPMTPKDLEEQKVLLKECISNFSVCIIGAPPKKMIWRYKDLVTPIDDVFYGRYKNRLAFGLIQYIDKETGVPICIAATNALNFSILWDGGSWEIKEGKPIQYILWYPHFSTRMTPKSLYEAMLASHKDAVKEHKIKEFWGDE